MSAPRILLYSDDVTTREHVRLAVGPRLGRGEPDIEWTEVASWAGFDEVALRRRTPFDLYIVDGEAAKAGGLGAARQLKDEVYDCGPVLVLTGRPQDAWLASWSNADAAVPQPLDPIVLQAEVARLVAERAASRAGAPA